MTSQKSAADYQTRIQELELKVKQLEARLGTVDGKDMEFRKEYEARLQEAQKLQSIGVLAGGIAHDFNNILTPIIGYTEMALEQCGKDSSRVRRYLERIARGSNRAKELIRQILTFSRRNSDKLQPIDLTPLISEALKLIRSSLPSTIEIKTELGPENSTVMADPVQMHQVIVNLCANSGYAMRNQPQGHLEISLENTELKKDSSGFSGPVKAGNYLLLTVTDSGEGISSELVDRIFDPFFTTKMVGEGIGMGLSVVHGIVSSMGGCIKVHSETGKGTRFMVYLPCIEKHPVKTGEESPVRSKIRFGNGQNILLVDDEATIIEMLSDMLKALKYNVTSTTESPSALELFSANPEKYDLVITDQTMPGLTGVMLSREMFKIRPDIPVIICSGYSDSIVPAEILKEGIRGFLTKPLSRNVISQKIYDILNENTE